jgi:L-ascorbate metabolism protein UlaG (beta-lactamase superfamily)
VGNRYYDGSPSDHFNGKRFFNPGQPPTDKTLTDVLRWKLTGKPAKWPAQVPGFDGDVPPPKVTTGLRLTMVGHASVLIQLPGVNILLDPVWSDRASPFRRLGPIRHNPPGIAFEDLPPIHAVLITHNHYDHLDIATIERLWHAHHPLILAPLGNDRLIHQAAPEVKVTAGDWGDRFDLAPEVQTTLCPAYHWSARALGDRRMALWCGFILHTPAGVIYLTGDTGYNDGAIFREVRERFGSPALALLPIGAYEPRWFMRNQHVNPAEAVQILEDTGAACAVGLHWGTFRLTDEAADAPLQALAAALAQRSIAPERFIALRPGQVWTTGPLQQQRERACTSSSA